MEIIRASERGYNDHGWLKTYHTFSFANYYNPQRVHFGTLRVVNDDHVEGYHGFGTHPHDNMEIISIPLSGKLAHKDSTGINGVITPGEVQVMSAGTGVTHSEKNPCKEPVHFLQIWIFPNKEDVTPRYDQRKFEETGYLNKIQLLVSPDGRNDSLWIYQNAFLSRAKYNDQKTITYQPYIKENGLFVFLLDGKVLIDDQELDRRDTVLFKPGSGISFQTKESSEFIFIEVPMQA